MLSIAAARCSGAAASCFAAVVTIPVPSRFVRNSASPGRAPPFINTRAGCTSPSTQSPNFGSASMIVCPPATIPPASVTLSRAAPQDFGHDVRRQILREKRRCSAPARPRRPSHRRRSSRSPLLSRRRRTGRPPAARRSPSSSRPPARRSAGRRPRRRARGGRPAGSGRCWPVAPTDSAGPALWTQRPPCPLSRRKRRARSAVLAP